MRKIGVVISPEPVDSDYSGFFKTCFLVLDEDNNVYARPKDEYKSLEHLSVVVFEDANTDNEHILFSPLVFQLRYDRYSMGNSNNYGGHVEKYTCGDLTITDPYIHYGGDPQWVGYACDDRLLDVVSFQNVFLHSSTRKRGDERTDVRLLPLRVKQWIDYFVVNRKHYFHRLKASNAIEWIEKMARIIDTLDINQVIESYKIEITYHHISKIGGDDRYYEEKTYSIQYRDSYLDQWFKTGSEELHRESAYTSYFERVNEYKRFTEEENEAKERAYNEYNRLEHLKALVKPFFLTLKKEFTTPQEDFLSPEKLNSILPLNVLYKWESTFMGKKLYSKQAAISTFQRIIETNPPF